MEDLDTPRCVAGAAEDILHTLEIFGMRSDEAVVYQSQRTHAYEDALQQLQRFDAIYPCCCSRKEIADSAWRGIEGPVYPGTCRRGMPSEREARAWRLRTDSLFSVRPELLHGCAEIPPLNPPCDKLNMNGEVIEFKDELQGRIIQHIESEIGDFVVKRSDGLFAYQLAVVVDDAAQGITHIVRGADLLNSTPRQIYLQHLLGLTTPHYMLSLIHI